MKEIYTKNVNAWWALYGTSCIALRGAEPCETFNKAEIFNAWCTNDDFRNIINEHFIVTLENQCRLDDVMNPQEEDSDEDEFEHINWSILSDAGYDVDSITNINDGMMRRLTNEVCPVKYSKRLIKYASEKGIKMQTVANIMADYGFIVETRPSFKMTPWCVYIMDEVIANSL